MVLGFTFKENCPDIRNTRVVDLIKQFDDFNCSTEVYDPWVDMDAAIDENNIKLIEEPTKGKYDAIILAVAHDVFKNLSPEQIKTFGKENHVIYDIKYLLSSENVDGRL